MSPRRNVVAMAGVLGGLGLLYARTGSERGGEQQLAYLQSGRTPVPRWRAALWSVTQLFKELPVCLGLGECKPTVPKAKAVLVLVIAKLGYAHFPHPHL
jgi:hypothetical protein